MILNSTNAQLIARAVGSEETEDWPGKQIVLFNDPNVQGVSPFADILWSGREPADVSGMRRSARVLVLVGTVGAVFGLAKVHALTHTYDITDSGRLGWSLAYVGVLLLAAYAVGLPSLPRSRNQLLVSAGGAALGATLMSVVTLVAGGQLLPRFVIFIARCSNS